MQSNQNNRTFLDEIKLFLSKRKNNKDLNIGDIGIYEYPYTLTDDKYTQKYNVELKVKIKSIFFQLVEVEILDTTINELAIEEVCALIKKTYPKYINPEHIRWEIKK
jgi:hypothetical protein